MDTEAFEAVEVMDMFQGAEMVGVEDERVVDVEDVDVVDAIGDV